MSFTSPTTGLASGTAGVGSRVHYSRWLSEAVATILAVAGLWLTAVAIARDIERRPPTGQTISAPVARVVRASGSVKRRDAAGLVWDRVGIGSTLAAGDGLFVPASAWAEVGFLNGAIMIVEANSLVVIDVPHEQTQTPSLVLRRGRINVTTRESGLEIVALNSRAILDAAAAAQVSADAEEQARVNVVRGRATVVRDHAPPISVQHGSVEIGRKGLRRVDSAVVLREPSPASRRYFSGSRGSVSFVWEARGDVVFELGDDRGFSRVLLTRRVGGGHLVLDSLAAGSYYWRVRALDASWTSEPGFLLMLRDEPPQIVMPAAGHVLYAPGDTKVRFRWTPVEGAPAYHVQIARAPTFASSVVERDVQEDELRLSAFGEEGVYYWRVRVLDPERDSPPYSPPAKFRLIVEPLPEPPELYTPELDSTPGRDGAEGEPAAPVAPSHGFWCLFGGVALAQEPIVAKASALAITLRWSAVPGIEVYVLEIATDERFTRVVLREQVKRPFYSWRTYGEGTHWWRVRSVDAKGREGVSSAVRRVEPPSRTPPAVVTPAPVKATAKRAQTLAASSPYVPPSFEQGLASLPLVPHASVDTDGETQTAEQSQAEPETAIVAATAADDVPEDIPPQAPVTAAVASLPALRLGVSAGLLSNFNTKITPAFSIEAGRALSPTPWSSVWARLGYHQKVLRGTTPVASTAQQHVGVLALGVRADMARAPIVSYATLALAAAFLRARTTVVSQPVVVTTTVGLGAEAALGVELSGFSNGAPFLELRYAWLRRRSVDVSFDGGGMLAALGYRLTL